jgi:hypothetical protein
VNIIKFRKEGADRLAQRPFGGGDPVSDSAADQRENLVVVPQEKAPLDGDDTGSDDVRVAVPFDATRIRIEAKSAIMDLLIKRIKNEEIDLTPAFQRSSEIWNDTVRSRLIESLILRIPIPSFYLDATCPDRWIVVDGLQRLSTIKRFVVDESLQLQGLEFLTDYDGKKFSDLPRNFKRNIEESDITMYLIKETTTDVVKFTLFKRINTGGQPLNSQEIRHALNQGPVTDFLRKMAESKEFLEATAGGVAAKRMDDRECVTRFLAFRLFSPDGYNRDDFDDFLNKTMVKVNALNESEREALGDAFLGAMRTSTGIFGNDAFRKRYDRRSERSTVNKALFEAWSVNLAGLSDKETALLMERKEQLKERFIALMKEDKDFEGSVSQSTGSVARVKCRFAKIAGIIREVLDA